MVTRRLVDATLKKTFTRTVTSLQFDPCLSTTQIYESIFPSISLHFPDLEFGEIDIVVTGSYGTELGQPENAPALDINHICFKNTPHWRGYDEVYTFYTRPKISQNGDECPICYAPITNIHRPFICHHGFCRDCISTWITHSDHPTCPTCRSELSPHYRPPSNYIQSIDNNINNDDELMEINYMSGLNEILQNVIINNNNYNYNNYFDNNINHDIDNNNYNNYINIAT